MSINNLASRSILVGVLAFGACIGELFAQRPPTGAVTGRVFNVATGGYLNNAHITVDDISVEAFTNDFGEYRLVNLPPGEVTVRAFYTGLAVKVRTVKVESGGTATLDFELLPSTAPVSAKEDDVVRMAALEVRASGEIAASAVAINEQRFAPNIKSVVDIGEFGDLGDSNVGEFIKFLPGVSIEYNGNEPRTVAVRGFAATYTALTIDGNRAASAASGQITRNTELIGFALNNLARIEVTKTPTPDVPADSIGGAVNLVSRSAFERRRPLFSFHAYGTFNSDNVSLHNQSGPSDKTTGPAVRPGFDFVYQNPVNKKFAFSLNGQYFQRFNSGDITREEWSPTSARIGTGTETNPYLSRFQLQTGPQAAETTSIGGVVDYRITPIDVISLGTSFVRRETFSDGQILEWLADAGTGAVSWGPTFTNGGTAGRVGFNGSYRHKTSDTAHTNLSYRHNGPTWKADAGVFYSRATNTYRDISEGYFRTFNIRRRDVTVNYADIGPIRPGSITTTIGATPLNPYVLDDLIPEQGNSEESDALDVVRGGHWNISRDLGFSNPVNVKVGFDLREKHRDIDTRSTRWDFRGSDNSGARPTTGPNSELIRDLSARYGVGFATDSYAQNTPEFGFPTVQWPSSQKLYEFFRATESQWREDEVFKNNYSATLSPVITETITSGYIRGDAKFLEHRLWLVGGVRYEFTRNEGTGALKGPTIGTISYYTPRGDQRVKSYGDLFPSFNASYMIARNLIGRFAYSQTIGRPDFGEIVPGVFPDTTAYVAGEPRLIVNNPDLKPAISNNYDLSIEYYFEDSGVLSAGVFRKDIRDFLGQTSHAVTPEEIVLYGLDANYLGAEILIKQNVDSAKIQGIEFNYKQPLTFLPDWARGVHIFANLTSLQLTGDNVTDFSGFQPRSYNWGISLKRQKYDCRLNWNYTGRQRGLLITGLGVPPNTFDYVEARLLLDVNFSYKLTKRLSLYGSARNVTQEPIERLRYSPNTPDHAKPLRYEKYGVQFSLGLRGAF